jgi:hypothetical protein
MQANLRFIKSANCKTGYCRYNIILDTCIIHSQNFLSLADLQNPFHKTEVNQSCSQSQDG